MGLRWWTLSSWGRKQVVLSPCWDLQQCSKLTTLCQQCQQTPPLRVPPSLPRRCACVHAAVVLRILVLSTRHFCGRSGQRVRIIPSCVQGPWPGHTSSGKCCSGYKQQCGSKQWHATRVVFRVHGRGMQAVACRIVAWKRRHACKGCR